MLRWVVVCRGWWRWVDSLVGWSGWLCVLRSCCARETRGFRGCTSGTARQNTEPVSRGSHYLRFNYFPLEVCRIASRVFPLRRRYLSSRDPPFSQGKPVPLLFTLRSRFPPLPPSHQFSIQTALHSRAPSLPLFLYLRVFRCPGSTRFFQQLVSQLISPR